MLDQKSPSANQKNVSFWEKITNFFVPEKNNNYLPRALDAKYLFWYGFAIFFLKITILALIIFLPNTILFSDITSSQLLNLINKVRQGENLPPLTLNQQLNKAAELKANDMVANNYFDHISPSGITPWHWFKKAGYQYIYAGENLAMDFWESESVFNAWMNSPTHRANILNPNFKEVGLAVVNGQIQNHQATLAVLDFGTQIKNEQKKIASSKSISTPSNLTPPASTPAPILTSSLSPTKINNSPSLSPLSLPSPEVNTLQPSPSGSLTPPVLAENIQKPELSPALTPSANYPNSDFSTFKENPAPKVLGVFVTRAEEMAKCFYLYFLLFLLAALGVNIFVKIKIQHWQTIIATLGLILICGAFIFI